jgi:hypothetical protein
MTEVICTDGKFSPQQMELFSRYDVEIPMENSFYTIREVIKPSGKVGVGVLLEEIVNPKIPLAHPILGGTVMMEVNWSITRFSTLSRDTLTREMIEQKKTVDIWTDKRVETMT